MSILPIDDEPVDYVGDVGGFGVVFNPLFHGSYFSAFFVIVLKSRIQSTRLYRR